MKMKVLTLYNPVTKATPFVKVTFIYFSRKTIQKYMSQSVCLLSTVNGKFQLYKESYDTEISSY